MKPQELIQQRNLSPVNYKTKTKKIGIYMIYCVANEKAYVGQSRNIFNRFRTHKSALRNKEHENSYLQNVFNKHGLNTFSFLILEECEVKQLLDREIYYYELLDKEFRINLREPTNNWAMTKDAIEKGASKRRGRPKTEEEKRKLSEAQKGKFVSEETKKKMSETWKKKLENPEILAQRLKQVELLAEKRRGQKLSKEWCEKMSKSHTGGKILQNKTRFLTIEQVREIKRLLTTKELTPLDIGKKFKVSRNAIYSIKNRHSWKHA